MPLSFEPERVPSGLCKYYLYQYTHVLLSCCTLVCPIGMPAKPEQPSALNLSTLSFEPERAQVWTATTLLPFVPSGLCK